MDKELFKKGLGRRKSTLGESYVVKNLESADDFTRPFQEAMTEWCWGFGWGDDAIDAKTRSMMNLAMLGALGKMHEWELHCRGAVNNGVSKEEIRAIIHVVGNLLWRSSKFGVLSLRSQSIERARLALNSKVFRSVLLPVL